MMEKPDKQGKFSMKKENVLWKGDFNEKKLIQIELIFKLIALIMPYLFFNINCGAL